MKNRIHKKLIIEFQNIENFYISKDTIKKNEKTGHILRTFLHIMCLLKDIHLE